MVIAQSNASKPFIRQYPIALCFGRWLMTLSRLRSQIRQQLATRLPVFEITKQSLRHVPLLCKSRLIPQSSITNIIRILSLTSILAGDVALASSTNLFLPWVFSSSISAAYSWRHFMDFRPAGRLEDQVWLLF